MNRKMLAVGLAALAGTAVSANARPAVYTSGFESPTYVAGTGPGGQLIPGAGATGPSGVGQDNWFYYSSAVTSNNPHVIADSTKAYQGTNYLQVNTGSGTSGFGTSTSARSTFTYHGDPLTNAQLAGKVMHVGVAVHTENIASATRITGQTVQVYDQAFALLGAMRLQSNGVFAFYTAANSIGLGGALNDTWYRFDMYFDWALGKVFYFINGIDQSGVLDGAGFNRSFVATDYSETDLVDSRFASSTGNASQGHVHRWDSFRLDVDNAPAPASAALLGLGGLLAARRRRS